MAEENIKISQDEICDCIRNAEELIVLSTGQPFDIEEKLIAETWCKSCIAPEFIAEYLRGGHQWFVVAAVIRILDRELNESEINSVIYWYQQGWDVEDIVEDIKCSADKISDSPAC